MKKLLQIQFALVLLFYADCQFLQNRKVTFTKTLCFIFLNVFFSVCFIKKARKEKHKTSCCVTRKSCYNAHLLLTSLYINNIIEQKRLQIKHKFLKKEPD